MFMLLLILFVESTAASLLTFFNIYANDTETKTEGMLSMCARSASIESPEA